MYANTGFISKPAPIDHEELTQAMARGRKLRSQMAWYLIARAGSFIRQTIQRKDLTTTADSLWEQASTVAAKSRQASRVGWI